MKKGDCLVVFIFITMRKLLTPGQKESQWWRTKAEASLNTSKGASEEGVNIYQLILSS